MGVTTTSRGLGSGISKGCMARVEDILHVFQDFPSLLNVGKKICD